MAVLLAFAAIAAGCGSSDSRDPASSGKDTEATTYYPPGPSSEFIIPGGDNTIQYFGREASKADREEASAVVAGWMRARAAKDWRRDCHYLSRSFIDNLVTDAEKVSKGKATSCPQALGFFGPVASGNSVNTMTGPIDSLRVGQEGEASYAQYHGRKGIDWIVPMAKEGGQWKVAVSTPINRQS